MGLCQDLRRLLPRLRFLFDPIDQRAVSLPSRLSILEEVRRLAARGIREVNLVSQDTTYFGRDRGRSDGLAVLLVRLADLEEPWVRLLYGYPEEVTPALLEAMSHPKVCPYLDIPFQHADAALLRRMNRSMDGDRALKLLEKIRTKIPGIAVRTSLIVGLPGEGRAEFGRLKTFVKNAGFEHLGVFTYSREDGTGAYSFGDPVPQGTKDRRRDEIMAIQADISAGKMRNYVGQTLDVLVESPAASSPGVIIGRTRFQAPEVDGVVFVERGGAEPAGPAVRKVEIIDSGRYDLSGRFKP